AQSAAPCTRRRKARRKLKENSHATCSPYGISLLVVEYVGRTSQVPLTTKEGSARMLNLLLRWLLHALALLLVAWLVPGFHFTSFASILIAALVIGLLNATLGLLLKIITFPLAIITLGIF